MKIFIYLRLIIKIKPCSSFKRIISAGIISVIVIFILKAAVAKEAGASSAPNEMILIPEGQFIVGSDKRHPDEGPMHTVYIDQFYIDKFEVTNARYLRFAQETGRRLPDHLRNGVIPPGMEDHPVIYVNWYDARDYCHWTEKRLPTETEWEKAARGTDGRNFPWGNEFDARKANTPQLGLRHTMPVGSFPEGRSPYGVYDMSGNVWEWTESWYKAYPGNKRPAKENYGERYRVVRGGSWIDCSFYRCGISAFTFNRGFFKVETKNNSFGFRCAKNS